MNARTSRALGIIYSYPEIYIIYNVADGAFKWENKVERSFFFRAKQTFLSKLNGIHDSHTKMIFVGKDMGAFMSLLTTEKSSIKNIFNISSNYNDISFLDSSKFAVQQLKCFINKSARDDITMSINNNFSLKNNYRKYHSIMNDGTAVVNCTDCNLVAIKWVKEFLVKQGNKILIILFHFQLPYLEKYFGTGDNIEYCLISYADIFGE